jgi:hypothetical protein
LVSFSIRCFCIGIWTPARNFVVIYYVGNGKGNANCQRYHSG